MMSGQISSAIPADDLRAVVSGPSRARIHWLEAKYELLKMLRLPAFVLPTLLFPLIFYIFFGVAFGHGKVAGLTTMAAYLIATYGAFGVIGASLIGIGAGVATERGQGWLQVKRATPMPLTAWFGAKLALAMLFSAVIVLGLFALGMTFGGVHFAPAVWAKLFVTLIFGALPFCALGLAVGYFAGPNSAPAIVNLIYLPMSFASGLWIPIPFLPGFVQKLALFLPPYHLAQLALNCIGAGTGSPRAHALALAGFTALFLVLATIGYRRDEGKTYG
jgi:ABC-2 type transport system permease protein